MSAIIPWSMMSRQHTERFFITEGHCYQNKNYCPSSCDFGRDWKICWMQFPNIFERRRATSYTRRLSIQELRITEESQDRNGYHRHPKHSNLLILKISCAFCLGVKIGPILLPPYEFYQRSNCRVVATISNMDINPEVENMIKFSSHWSSAAQI